MQMNQWVKMLKEIAKGSTVKIPAQILLKGQINAIIDALGGAESAASYFESVQAAEPAEIDDKLICSSEENLR